MHTLHALETRTLLFTILAPTRHVFARPGRHRSDSRSDASPILVCTEARRGARARARVVFASSENFLICSSIYFTGSLQLVLENKEGVRKPLQQNTARFNNPHWSNGVRKPLRRAPHRFSFRSMCFFFFFSSSSGTSTFNIWNWLVQPSRANSIKRDIIDGVSIIFLDNIKKIHDNRKYGGPHAKTKKTKTKDNDSMICLVSSNYYDCFFNFSRIGKESTPHHTALSW